MGRIKWKSLVGPQCPTNVVSAAGQLQITSNFDLVPLLDIVDPLVIFLFLFKFALESPSG